MTNTNNDFKTFGAFVNLNREINYNFCWHTEARTLNSKDAIFQKQNSSLFLF